MKVKLYIILAVTCIFTSCDFTSENKAKESVRECLNKYRIYNFKEREWSKIDSIFFPHEINRKYEQAHHWVKGDIFTLENTIKKLNRTRDKKRIETLRDSISYYENKLKEMDEKYRRIISEAKPNRKSISLILTYKNSFGLEKTEKITFVFDENSWNVTNIIDEYNNQTKL